MDGGTPEVWPRPVLAAAERAIMLGVVPALLFVAFVAFLTAGFWKRLRKKCACSCSDSPKENARARNGRKSAKPCASIRNWCNGSLGW